MQILIFSLIVILLLGYIFYKLNQFYSKKVIVFGTLFIIGIIWLSIYLSNNNEVGINKAFKAKYKKEFGYKIDKLSSNIINKGKNLSLNEYFYKFIYIVKKDNKEFVCEANDIFVQVIEDEYVFKEIKEKCREK